MRDFLKRVFNTEFLPMSEVRKLKVSLVMVFLLIMTAMTIPLSFFFDYEIYVKIGVIAFLILFFFITELLVRSDHTNIAIHFTIIYSVALTFFYTLGLNNFYTYLFFYITLIVIIFYQDLSLYILYGFVVVLTGSIYTFIHQSGLVLVNDINGSVYLYLAFLLMFYVIFFIQILLNEKLYTDVNYEWVRMNHIIDKYQEHILYFLRTIHKDDLEAPFYEDLDFQKAADEISTFIYEQFRDNGRDITNVLDLYIYVHERGIEKILENDEFSVSTKKIANRLNKYLIDQPSEMLSMIINFHTKFRSSNPYKSKRYTYQLEKITPYSDEQIIGFGLMYLLLTHEVFSLDQWDELSKKLTIKEVDELLSSSDIESFLTRKQLGFYKDNYDLFIEILAKNKN